MQPVCRTGARLGKRKIQEFCSLNYGDSRCRASSKSGHERHQLYRLLAGEAAEFPGTSPWNFEKFLLGKGWPRAGAILAATGAGDPTIVHAIEKALSVKS